MAEKAIRLLKDDELRSVISEEASKISEYYSEEKITDRFLTYITGICEG